jgi:Flp pilus assembly protein TadD
MAMAGNAALAGGDAVASEPLFAQAVQAAANSGDASLIAGLQVDHARALVASGRPDDAARVLADARTSDAANLRAWLLSATLSRRLQRLGEAQKQIEQAAILAPRDPAVGLEAGVIAALSGREDDARRSFESVLVVDPDSDEASRARAYLEQLGQ